MTGSALRLLSVALLCSIPGFGCARGTNPSPPPAPAGGPAVGILVMAHGGTPEWDKAVTDAVVPLKSRIPIALALGMADPRTMQAALDSLQERGVREVAVVRLFLSGESFLHETEFYLGLRPDAPSMSAMMMMGPGEHHSMAPPKPLTKSADILLETRGLSEAPTTALIVADRVRAVSRDPRTESVILVAHGMGDEAENQRVIDNMGASVEGLRALGFKAVRAATLREDWPEVRVQAETQIREWVSAHSTGGDRVIVVPFRLFGFGGYADVLKGLDYVATDGLLPHDRVADWISESATSLFCARGDANPLARCR